MRVPLLRDAIRLASMVYENESELEPLWENRPIEQQNQIVYKLTKPISFYSTPEDAQCVCTQYEDGCCMVFRGTTNLNDWMTNMQAIQVPLNLPGIFGQKRPLVHSGFLGQFQSISMTLMRHAAEYMSDTEIRDSNRTFYYFGHSLGGALATVAAVVFGAMYPEARHVCITFGSPRVGDTLFVEQFKKHVDESVRCVNQEDPVPMVPTSCSYHHVPGVLYFDRDEKAQTEITENRILQSCRDGVLCCCGLAESPIDDHATTQYEIIMNKI